MFPSPRQAGSDKPAKNRDNFSRELRGIKIRIGAKWFGKIITKISPIKWQFHDRYCARE